MLHIRQQYGRSPVQYSYQRSFILIPAINNDDTVLVSGRPNKQFQLDPGARSNLNLVGAVNSAVLYPGKEESTTHLVQHPICRLAKIKFRGDFMLDGESRRVKPHGTNRYDPKDDDRHQNFNEGKTSVSALNAYQRTSLHSIIRSTNRTSSI